MTFILKTYRERIRDEHKTLDARGVMQMHRQVDMALDDIYVTLNARIKGEGIRDLPLPDATTLSVSRGAFVRVIKASRGRR